MSIHKRSTLFKLISLCLLTFLVGCTKVAEVPTSEATQPLLPNSSSETISDSTHAPESEPLLESSAEIHFIDTGNSDSILIKEGTKAILIDGADNDDEKSLVDYIKAQGITELEYVIATHPHADHIGALDSVIQNFPINYLFVANGDAETQTYKDFIQAAMDKNLTPSVPLEDKKFMLEESYFEVFNTNGGKDANEQSLVVLYTNGQDKLLLTGDAEQGTEAEILPKMPKVDILKVGHHGSHSSTTDAFLERVAPEYAIITVGTNNKYGHPHIETVDKLKKANIEVHRTDECSDIIFYSTGKGVHTECAPGSYNRGTTSSDTSSSSPTAEVSKPKKPTPSTQAVPAEASGNAASHLAGPSTKIVYWTPSGKSYHTTQDCSTLSRSKTILSGTLAESGKSDPCNQCY